uniref:Uncharacterized protein n=1 Tax=Nitratidesulfovibrio vulgaris (strain DSM 19637 / Miyazaki F) TaxID=883 RepID=B8DKY7_NITV9
MNIVLKQEALRAEIAATKAQLQQVSDGDILGRIGMEQRLEELQSELNEIENIHQTIAESVIYFGGAPVQGSSGISAMFAAEALRKYQDLVTVVLASDRCGDSLSESGPLPCRNESTLHITGTPRGSFGFCLQEIVSQRPLTDSAPESAVERANQLISAAKIEDADVLEESISKEHSRVLTVLSDFFRTLKNYGATARILSRDTDVVLNKNLVDIAVMNTDIIKMESKPVIVNGIFQGATIVSRNFDFIADSGVVIEGKISKEIADELIHIMDVEYTGKRCTINTVRTETTKQGSKRPKHRWLLTDIKPLD